MIIVAINDETVGANSPALIIESQIFVPHKFHLTPQHQGATDQQNDDAELEHH
ncbi:MAG TPA: hypothetical protein VFD35_09730 [Pricia sp.]|nr:hypothetical protein [Pricia sp.]